MSIHSSISFGNYMMDDYRPEWIKAERYDYCEPYYNKESKTLLARIIEFFR